MLCILVNVKQSNSAGKRAKKNYTFNIHNVTIIRLPPTTQANCSFVRYRLSSSEYQLIYMNHTAKNINEMRQGINTVIQQYMPSIITTPNLNITSYR